MGSIIAKWIDKNGYWLLTLLFLACSAPLPEPKADTLWTEAQIQENVKNYQGKAPDNAVECTYANPADDLSDDSGINTCCAKAPCGCTICGVEYGTVHCPEHYFEWYLVDP